MQAIFAFALLTFVVSWLLWAAAAATLGWDLSWRVGPVALGGSLYLLGVFAPAFVAIALTAQRDGPEGVLTLLRRTLNWSASSRWYLFALGYFAIIKLPAASPFALRATFVTWATVALLWLGALFFLAVMRGEKRAEPTI